MPSASSPPRSATLSPPIPGGERERAFYHCWTRKEAYLKAVGDGVAAPLDRFDVSLEPGDARLLAVDGDPALAGAWSLTHIEPGPGYVGALALVVGPRTVRGWHWGQDTDFGQAEIGILSP